MTIYPPALASLQAKRPWSRVRSQRLLPLVWVCRHATTFLSSPSRRRRSRPPQFRLLTFHERAQVMFPVPLRLQILPRRRSPSRTSHSRAIRRSLNAIVAMLNLCLQHLQHTRVFPLHPHRISLATRRTALSLLCPKFTKNATSVSHHQPLVTRLRTPVRRLLDPKSHLPDPGHREDQLAVAVSRPVIGNGNRGILEI